jgi:uncharacterized protein YbgA (DUF1722 family)/uncharacterized protein YbbK (DUF523 family)
MGGMENVAVIGAAMTGERIRLGISACLLGQPVRFDGGHKRDTFLTEALARFVDWVPVCPEEEAGLGTPREAMRLVHQAGAERLIGVRSQRDLTDTLTDFAAARVPQLMALNLDGFVLKKDSPSCGLIRVKVYSGHGVPARTGRGLFAAALCAALPTLPVEDEGRLNDPVIRENFIERIYAFRRVRHLLETHTRLGDLVRFHTQHKLQLLAHSPAHYTALGRFVAHARATAPQHLMPDYGRAFTTALTTTVTRARHVNVLQHAAGYFRRVLSAAARRDVAATIVDYQRRLIPLVVPLRLIEHYARLHDVQYLCNQTYLNPYPHELMLRNHV